MITSRIYRNQFVKSTKLFNKAKPPLAALNRIDDRTFGYCDNCGLPINPERLEAIPFARNCVPSAEKLDQELADYGEGLEHSKAQTLGQRTARNAHRVCGRKSSGNKGSVVGKRTGTDTDIHAAGTAGGGTVLGGLAGTNVGRGDPRGSTLERATGSGGFDADNRSDFKNVSARTIRSDGAMSGAPTSKRAKQKTGEVTKDSIKAESKPVRQKRTPRTSVSILPFGNIDTEIYPDVDIIF